MNQLGTVYATKRRRRNSKSLKPQPKDGTAKSNPSKRHRERLNAELDTLASLLPFESTILSKLDKLSILRLSVSYLRTKSYFQVAMFGVKDHSRNHESSRNHELPCLEAIMDSDLILQALNGFLLILASEGEVFFASHTIEGYLGFHQSDIVHQSVYELVHSEDREELQRQLTWNSFLPPDGANMSLQEILQPENVQYLERSFTVRFRCLLDNTSGFLRLDIRGRIKILHGQNRKTEEPPLALFAVCTPFGPPSLLEVPQKDVMFKSKHKLDMCLVSMDQRGKMLLGYADSELANKGGYDLVHFDDLAYVANAHQELLKTGASGMIAYRVITKDSQWQWLQTSSRLVYKCSKPDFIICTHRPLMEEEGRDLLGKRTMDFKVSYLDATLSSSSYTTDSEYPTDPSSRTSATTIQPPSGNSGKPAKPRRYKNQLRDILTTSRKRKSHDQSGHTNPAAGTPLINSNSAANPSLPDYANEDPAGLSAAYHAAHHHPLHPHHQQVYSPYDNGVGYATTPAMYPTTAALEQQSRYLSAEDFLQYRHLNYYTDYSPYSVAVAAHSSNGYGLPPPPTATSSYDTMGHPALSSSKDDKLYATCQLQQEPLLKTTAYNPAVIQQKSVGCCDPYSGGSTELCGRLSAGPLVQPLLLPVDSVKLMSDESRSGKSRNDEQHGQQQQQHHHHLLRQQQQQHSGNQQHQLHDSNHHAGSNGSLSGKQQQHNSSYSNDTRQTVLMWGSTGCRSLCNSVSSSSSSGSPPAQSTHVHPAYSSSAGTDKSAVSAAGSGAGLRGGEMLQQNLSCKWAAVGAGGGGGGAGTTPKSGSPVLHPSSPHGGAISSRGVTPASYHSSPYSSDATTETFAYQPL